MQTTIDIDEDILRAARECANATGRTTGDVISEMARRGFDLAPIEPARTRDEILDLRLDPSLEITSDTIDELLNSIERDDDLGFPLAIDDVTRKQIELLAREQRTAPGRFAANLVQEDLLRKGTWPLQSGVAVFPTRGREALTLEEIDAMLDEL